MQEEEPASCCNVKIAIALAHLWRRHHGGEIERRSRGGADATSQLPAVVAFQFTSNTPAAQSTMPAIAASPSCSLKSSHDITAVTAGVR
jgi:hypothetical protein